MGFPEEKQHKPTLQPLRKQPCLFIMSCGCHGDERSEGVRENANVQGRVEAVGALGRSCEWTCDLVLPTVCYDVTPQAGVEGPLASSLQLTATGQALTLWGCVPQKGHLCLLPKKQSESLFPTSVVLALPEKSDSSPRRP